MTLLYLKTVERKIQDKNFYQINLVDFEKCVIVRIYKTVNDTIKNKLVHFKQFQDVTEYIKFDIRRDGKISLDIK